MSYKTDIGPRSWEPLMRELHDRGLTPAEMAKESRLVLGTIYARLRHMGLKPHRRAE